MWLYKYFWKWLRSFIFGWEFGFLCLKLLPDCRCRFHFVGKHSCWLLVYQQGYLSGHQLILSSILSVQGYPILNYCWLEYDLFSFLQVYCHLQCWFCAYHRCQRPFLPDNYGNLLRGFNSDGCLNLMAFKKWCLSCKISCGLHRYCYVNLSYLGHSIKSSHHLIRYQFSMNYWSFLLKRCSSRCPVQTRHQISGFYHLQATKWCPNAFDSSLL